MRPFGSARKYCSEECTKAARKIMQKKAQEALFAAHPEKREHYRLVNKLGDKRRRQCPEYDARVKAQAVDYQRQRRKVDPAFLLRTTLGNRLNSALKSQNAERSFAIEEIVGCTMAELKQHLEEQFEPGMSWEPGKRYLWHIDHIKPCDLFDHNDIEQVKECWHWSNLQPLWAKDNLQKGNRCDGLEAA